MDRRESIDRVFQLLQEIQGSERNMTDSKAVKEAKAKAKEIKEVKKELPAHKN